MKNRIAALSAWNFRRALSGLALGGVSLLLPSLAQAGLISSVLVGSTDAPYSYGLTIEFANGNYYDFTLRSATASYSGYDFINTVAALSHNTAAPMTVNQVNASFGSYISGITIANDTNSGFANNSYWAYWNSTTLNPPQWTYSQVGESDRTLTPGQADGWVYGANGDAQPPQANAFAVPEPGTWTLLALGAGVLLARVKRRRVAV